MSTNISCTYSGYATWFIDTNNTFAYGFTRRQHSRRRRRGIAMAEASHCLLVRLVVSHFCFC